MTSTATLERPLDAEALIADMGRRARAAAAVLARVPTAAKAQALIEAAKAIRASESSILAANAIDLERGEANGLAPAMIDRLKLDPSGWKA